MLQLTDLCAGYGAHEVLHGVSLTVGAGEFVAVIGANGAGKSTLFRAISGTVAASAGEIRFNGELLNPLPGHLRARRGIAHVPEGRAVFASLSVAENLELGLPARRDRAGAAAALERAYAWFPALAHRPRQLAGTLSGGEQQMLAIARGLCAEPRLLLLDEPSLGLSPLLADEILERIVAIRRGTGLTLLLVEQRMSEALALADRGCLLQTGRVVLAGPCEVLRDQARVRQAYLGM